MHQWGSQVLPQEAHPVCLTGHHWAFVQQSLSLLSPRFYSTDLPQVWQSGHKQAADPNKAEKPGQMPSSIVVACLDRDSGEQLKIIIQLWPLNQVIKMENCQAPSTKQSVAALSFCNEQECTQAINRQKWMLSCSIFLCSKTAWSNTCFSGGLLYSGTCWLRECKNRKKC